MKHTPGPWFINEERQNCMGDGIIFRSIYHKRNGFDVCLMQNNVIMGNLDKPEKSEGEANARLISTAPELLELAQAIVSQNEDGLDRSKWILDHAYALTKKAEGRE